MDDITSEITPEIELTTPLAVDMTRAFATSAAASAGTIAGFVIIGAAISKFQKIKKARADKKNQTVTE